MRGADPQASLLEIQILEIWGGGPGSCTFVPGDFFFFYAEAKAEAHQKNGRMTRLSLRLRQPL